MSDNNITLDQVTDRANSIYTDITYLFCLVSLLDVDQEIKENIIGVLSSLSSKVLPKELHSQIPDAVEKILRESLNSSKLNSSDN